MQCLGPALVWHARQSTANAVCHNSPSRAIYCKGHCAHGFNRMMRCRYARATHQVGYRLQVSQGYRQRFKTVSSHLLKPEPPPSQQCSEWPAKQRACLAAVSCNKQHVAQKQVAMQDVPCHATSSHVTCGCTNVGYNGEKNVTTLPTR